MRLLKFGIPIMFFETEELWIVIKSFLKICYPIATWGFDS